MNFFFCYIMASIFNGMKGKQRLLSEWVIEYQTPNEQVFSYIMSRTSYIQWNDDDVHFVLDQCD